MRYQSKPRPVLELFCVGVDTRFSHVHTWLLHHLDDAASLLSGRGFPDLFWRTFCDTKFIFLLYLRLVYVCASYLEDVMNRALYRKC